MKTRLALGTVLLATAWAAAAALPDLKRYLRIRMM
jgi:hypothetical protein